MVTTRLCNICKLPEQYDVRLLDGDDHYCRCSDRYTDEGDRICNTCNLPECNDVRLSENCNKYCHCIDNYNRKAEDAVCPVCAKCEPGAEVNVIYSVCAKHIGKDKATSYRDTEAAERWKEEQDARMPEAVLQFEEMVRERRAAYNAMLEAQAKFAWYRNHHNHTDMYKTCFGCDNEAKAKELYQVMRDREERLRLAALAHFKRMREPKAKSVPKAKYDPRSKYPYWGKDVTLTLADLEDC